MKNFDELALTEDDKVVLDAYYPDPALENTEFEDCFLEDVNDEFGLRNSKPAGKLIFSKFQN